MPFVLIFVALILIAAAWQNSQGALASNLASDARGFAPWFAALALVGGLQWIPKVQTPARMLLALVLTVLFLHSYKQIFAGFADLASGTAPAGTPSPAAAVIANPAAPAITQASVTGGGSTAGGNTSNTPAAPLSPFDPHALLARFAPGTTFDASSMGFGGIA